MLTRITDLPKHVVGFRAVGSVDKNDYEATLVPALEQLANETGEINFIMVLETDVSNFSAGAWLNDLKEGLKHFTKWNKVAIVTDQKAVEKVTDMFSAIIPGEAKGYPISDIELAKTWVAAPKAAK